MITNASEIREKVRIEDVVKKHVQNLDKRGVNLISLCPFHSEKTPSFTVSPTKNNFYCYGCGEGGDAVHFLMEHEGITYPEALIEAAKIGNIKVEYSKKTKPDELIEKEKALASLKESLRIAGQLVVKETVPVGLPNI